MIIKAAIFDLDGTVIESEFAWGKAFKRVSFSLGVNTDGQHPSTAGVSVKNNWKAILLKYNIRTDKTVEELEVLTYKEYEKLIPEINLRDGAVELITNLKDGGAEIALATSTSWQMTDQILKGLEIEDLFDSITTGEEVVNPKPAPDIFIMSAEKMSLEPEECLVFEDSLSGVTAAKEAGMKVIAIDPTGENKDLEGADLVVGEFSEVTPKAVAEL